MSKLQNKGMEDTNRIVELDVDKLEPFPDEASVYGNIEDQSIDTLVASYKKHGYIGGAILVSARLEGHLYIISGHRRTMACKACGIKTIPCQIIKNISEEKEKELFVDLNANRNRDGSDDITRARELLYSYDNYITNHPEDTIKISDYAKANFGYSYAMTQRFVRLAKTDASIQSLAENGYISMYTIDGTSTLPKKKQISIADDICKYIEEHPEYKENKSLIESSVIKEIISKYKVDKKKKKNKTTNVIQHIDPSYNILLQGMNGLVEEEDEDDIDIEPQVDSDHIILNAIQDLYLAIQETTEYTNQYYMKQRYEGLISFLQNEIDINMNDDF